MIGPMLGFLDACIFIRHTPSLERRHQFCSERLEWIACSHLEPELRIGKIFEILKSYSRAPRGVFNMVNRESTGSADKIPLSLQEQMSAGSSQWVSESMCTGIQGKPFIPWPIEPSDRTIDISKPLLMPAHWEFGINIPQSIIRIFCTLLLIFDGNDKGRRRLKLQGVHLSIL